MKMCSSLKKIQNSGFSKIELNMEIEIQNLRRD